MQLQWRQNGTVTILFMDTELFGIFKRKPNKAKGNESTSGFKPQILNIKVWYE